MVRSINGSVKNRVSIKRCNRKGEHFMNEYEVLIEDINPCGGERYCKKSFLEVRTNDPEEYVKENGRFPIMDKGVNVSSDLVITTGDGNGYFIRYTFTKL